MSVGRCVAGQVGPRHHAPRRWAVPKTRQVTAGNPAVARSGNVDRDSVDAREYSRAGWRDSERGPLERFHVHDDGLHLRQLAVDRPRHDTAEGVCVSKRQRGIRLHVNDNAV